MQDVKGSNGTGASVCASSSIPVGTEGRLIDKRDNKIYWVAKLKDGLCWMTQNLDYDGGSVDGYSGEDVATLTKGTSFASGTQSLKMYYDPGEYVYIEGPVTNDCSTTLIDGLNSCTDKGWISADELRSSWIATEDGYFVDATSFIGMDGRSICDKEAGSTFGNKNFSQCRVYYNPGYTHYYVGKYYNWAAATNSSASAANGENLDTSICPAGWKLPTGVSTGIGSFGGLLGGLKNGAQITIHPYYFLYGGYVNPSVMSPVSRSGQYWSSTAGVSTLAYSLVVLADSIDPSHASSNRYTGLSVRCVAR